MKRIIVQSFDHVPFVNESNTFVACSFKLHVTNLKKIKFQQQRTNTIIVQSYIKFLLKCI